MDNCWLTGKTTFLCDWVITLISSQIHHCFHCAMSIAQSDTAAKFYILMPRNISQTELVISWCFESIQPLRIRYIIMKIMSNSQYITSPQIRLLSRFVARSAGCQIRMQFIFTWKRFKNDKIAMVTIKLKLSENNQCLLMNRWSKHHWNGQITQMNITSQQFADLFSERICL